MLPVQRCTSDSHFQPHSCFYTTLDLSASQRLSFDFLSLAFHFALLCTHTISLWLRVYPSSWPHHCYSRAWRDPINHGVQIKPRIIVIENNGFHVSFSTALHCSYTYLETRGVRAHEIMSLCLNWANLFYLIKLCFILSKTLVFSPYSALCGFREACFLNETLLFPNQD